MLRTVPLFGLGNQGKSANVNAQQRTNLYLEVQADGEKNNLILYPTPGLNQFAYFGATPIRGMFESKGVVYVAQSNQLWRLLNDGTFTSVGTLLTYTGRVCFSDNGTQLMMVDGTYGYIFNTNTNTFTRITDADFPASTTCTFYNGRFIVNKTGTGQFYISALYDGFTWSALDFATAESDPDNLVRVFTDGGVMVLFGEKTTEFWGDSGAVDFPYARIGGSAIEWGLAAVWSLCKFNNSLIFLRRNLLGAVQVCIQTGTNSVPVSTPELDYVFSKYVSVADATGYAYMISGHPMYQINFPTANASWLYDGQSQSWSKVQFGNSGRHLGDIQTQFLTKNYVSDYRNGTLYKLEQDLYTDNGAAIVREFVGRHQQSGDLATFSAIWIEMEAGVGVQNGQGVTPKVMMQISRDGGHEWGQEVWRDVGAVGKYKTRAVFNCLGRARDWLFKFRVTDPIKTVFIGAWGRGG
jgi:hypothetical protein